MIIDSKYSKKFQSDNLTDTKFSEIKTMAIDINNLKNTVSKEISENLLFFLDMNPLSFVTYMRNKHKGEVSSNFDKQLYRTVIDSYQNKFDAIQNKLSFNKITFLGFEFYKRDTKGNKKGELKKVSIKKEKTQLSITLTYLARYGNNETVNYINNQLTTNILNEEKIKFYKNILTCINKFGLDRLLQLALQKRNRIVKSYSEKPIDFKSLTFGGRSRLKYILDYNKNYNSKINSFISLSWAGNRKKIDIPIKFSKDYHGHINDFKKKTNDYDYVITFNDKKKEVTINICKDGERYIPSDKHNLVGLDVNIKHNLFSLSDGSSFDYDRKLVKDFSELSISIDGFKKKDNSYIIGKRKQNKLDVLNLKIRKSNESLISSMCKKLNESGFDHIVMEDLNNGFGRSHIKDKNNSDINFNRVVKYLNMSSLKQEVEHIARNYGICVSTVHACYTSKMCPICGCIEDENRSSQETFKCIECGHEDNADTNASINIKNRVSEAVLRNKLLKKNDNGSFSPKVLQRDKVKEVLLSYRSSNLCCRDVKGASFS